MDYVPLLTDRRVPAAWDGHPIVWVSDWEQAHERRVFFCLMPTDEPGAAAKLAPIPGPDCSHHAMWERAGRG